MDQDKLIRDFKEMMETNHQDCLSVVEDRCSTIMERDEWEHRSDEVNDIMGTPEYIHMIASLDKPAIEDVWINWEGGEQPVDDDVMVEARFHGGEILGDIKASGLHWEAVAAYREIVEEKKPEKQTCETAFSAGASGVMPCIRCNRAVTSQADISRECVVEEKKPEKQTLWEFMDDRFWIPDLDKMDMLKGISEYLEKEDS